MVKLSILDKYISGKIIKNFFMIYSVVFCLMFIVQITRMTKFIPITAINFSNTIHFGAILMPNFLFVTHGILNSIIIYITYFSLLNSNELIIIKTSGFRNFRISISAIVFSFILFVIFLFVSFFVIPKVSSMNRKFVDDVKDTHLLSVIKADKVNNFKNVFIYYKEIENETMYDLVIYQFNQKNKQERETNVIYSPKAYFEKQNSGVFLVLLNSIISTITFKMENIDPKTTTSYISRIKLSSLLDKEDKEDFKDLNPKDMSMKKLINSAKLGDFFSFKEIHKRISIPCYYFFLNLSMIFLLLEMKISRSKNIKINVFGISMFAIFSILGMTSYIFIIKNYSIFNQILLYLIPIILMFMTVFVAKKIVV